MLSGTAVTLRPIRPEDLPILHGWHIDAETWIAGNDDPLWPMPFSVFEAIYTKAAEERTVEFAIEAAGSLVGRCGLFDVDDLARHATLGITIGAPHRGRGYGRDAVRVLLGYGFRLRNMHRIQLDTLATNEPALRAYRACGFVEEGRLREHGYANGEYVDVVLMGILRDEWLID
jgi:RimJ/RimL family protein N-acetyltransferase